LFFCFVLIVTLHQHCFLSLFIQITIYFSLIVR
jgi:hypothetical protein